VPLEPLDASHFGVESCFVCGPDNPRGLRIPFFHDTDRDLVVAMFELPDEVSGAPSFAHSGATLALLEEAMTWASIALRQKLAVTRETTVRFELRVRVGQPYRLEARVIGSDDETITTEAVVLDVKGRGCVTATAVLDVLDGDREHDGAGAAPHHPAPGS
jgi:acyl-coenzyme A thioesterase PaaI-like protein